MASSDRSPPRPAPPPTRPVPRTHKHARDYAPARPCSTRLDPLSLPHLHRTLAAPSPHPPRLPAKVLFEEYYVYHELGDDGLASAPSRPPSTASSSSSSAAAAAAVPPRIGFAPLAGCDFAAAEVHPASSLAVPAAAELGHDPAKAPEALPTQAIEDWGSLGRSGGGDRVEPRGAPPRPWPPSPSTVAVASHRHCCLSPSTPPTPPPPHPLHPHPHLHPHPLRAPNPDPNPTRSDKLDLVWRGPRAALDLAGSRGTARRHTARTLGGLPQPPPRASSRWLSPRVRRDRAQPNL